MITYPAIFEAHAESPAGMNESWKVMASKNESTCSIPEFFEGPGGTFSPEDYFVLALQNCFIATFKVFASYSRLAYERIKVDAILTVNQDSGGKPWVETVTMKIELNGVSDTKRAELLIKKTLDNGFILRSVKTEIKTEISIS